MSLYDCARCGCIENTAGADLFGQRRRHEAGRLPTFPLCKPCLNGGPGKWDLPEYLTAAEYEAREGFAPDLIDP